jgi:hypothetical protein
MPEPPSDPVNITIIYPPDFAAVEGGGAFRAFGYINPTNSANLMAEVLTPGPSTFAGTPVGSPTAPYDWEFTFTGVTADVWALLTVSADHPVTGDPGVRTHNIICVNGVQPLAAARVAKRSAKTRAKPRARKRK